jgi:hypothetical protein
MQCDYEMCGRIKIPKQGKSSHKYESTNTFFPSHSSANFVIISTDILNFGGQQMSMPIVGLYLTFKEALNAIISSTVYSPVSTVEPLWSCVLFLYNGKLYKKNRYNT